MYHSTRGLCRNASPPQWPPSSIMHVVDDSLSATAVEQRLDGRGPARPGPAAPSSQHVLAASCLALLIVAVCVLCLMDSHLPATAALATSSPSSQMFLAQDPPLHPPPPTTSLPHRLPARSPCSWPAVPLQITTLAQWRRRRCLCCKVQPVRPCVHRDLDTSVAVAPGWAPGRCHLGGSTSCVRNPVGMYKDISLRSARPHHLT